MDEAIRTAHEKLDTLKAALAATGGIAVAFSGGVDSTFLLAAAREALGDRVLALTARAPFIAPRESAEALDFCAERGIRQLFVDEDMAAIPHFAENPPDRCYHCKKALFTALGAMAAAEGITALAEGSNVDDQGDYRPGLRALAELGVLSPLKAAGLTKAEIRLLSREMGLATWDKPSFACLASRFPYGETITLEKLRMVDAAEQLLLDRGFPQMRVRLHGTLARIEVLPQDIGRLAAEPMRSEVAAALKEMGFSYVTLDLAGFRSGSMNEVFGK